MIERKRAFARATRRKVNASRPRRESAPHGVLWSGPSPIDSAPIVAIVTPRTRNRKTGPMLQVWVIRADIAPHFALASGQDSSVCGSCPMRSGRGCYVRTSDAPLSVWRKYQRGGYPTIAPEALAGWAIRWGAYGDPALIPADIVARANAFATMWTGYTHQWRTPHGARFRGVFMASVETLAGERKARAAGWGTFRVGARSGADMGETRLCASEASGATCRDCGLCNGRPVAVYIRAHGPGAKHVPAERAASKRQLHVLAEV